MRRCRGVGRPRRIAHAVPDPGRNAQLHVIRKPGKFHTVLSCAPDMYEDLWVGGKCMYKLESVVEDGGRLIIYAPHIREVSRTHGAQIRKIGYHSRDYFLGQMDQFRDVPLGVLAHASHVKGIGTFRDGVEPPRIDVILATSIPEEECRALNLGYCDYRKIHLEDYRDREGDGILLVQQAGEMLYQYEPPSFGTVISRKDLHD